MKPLNRKIPGTILMSLMVSVLTLILSGCGGSSNFKYPSITENATNQYRHGQIVWRDLVTPNPKKAAAFYQQVFGWQVQEINKDEQQYWLFKNNGKPIGGMYLMTEPRSGAGGEWVGSVSVASVDATANIAKAFGGSIEIKPFDMPGRGRTALIFDPQKAPLVLIHASGGDPPASDPQPNEWLWAENWANLADQSQNFYKSTFSSSVEEKMDDDRKYYILIHNGVKCAGIIKNPLENARSSWVQYIKVTDVKQTVQKAKEAGAKILLEPTESVRKGTVAILLDPTGAPVAIQEWPVK